MNCPLCHATEVDFYLEDHLRKYHQCNVCQLVFAAPASYLEPLEEKSRYDLHNNDPQDLNYRKFLSRTFDPVKAIISDNACGLDFGAGPGPTLSLMFEEAGHEMKIYDLFYANFPELLKPKGYDFVTCTEVIEHVQDPHTVIPMLLGLLKGQGPLAFMTKLCLGKEHFQNWHYKKDPTHICFYSKETFEYIARVYQCHLEFYGDDVILLTSK